MLFTLANLVRVDQMIRAWGACAKAPYLGGNETDAWNNENLKCGHVTHDDQLDRTEPVNPIV
jgi:hypothetical protein